MDSQITHEKDQKTKEYLLENMKKAILFIKGLNQRRSNILKTNSVNCERTGRVFRKGREIFEAHAS